MTLKELKIGDKFRLTVNGIDWVKDTNQGLDNQARL